MDQGYIGVRHSAHPARSIAGGRTALVLCFKGAGGQTGLMREEIETGDHAGTV